ncbi:MAG: hypothetical protein ACRCVG_04620 [Methanobacteriaceae archaeon]
MEELGIEVGQKWTRNKLLQRRKEESPIKPKKESSETNLRIKSQITDIKPQKDEEKVFIFLDNQKVAGMLKTIAEELNLEVGQTWVKKDLKRAKREKIKQLKREEEKELENIEAKITEIKEQGNDKDRVNVYLNGKYTLSTTKEIAEKLNLEIGQLWTNKGLKEKEYEFSSKIPGKITKIEPQNNPKRVSIYLDNRFALGVKKAKAKKLKVGQTWTMEDIEHLYK